MKHDTYHEETGLSGYFPGREKQEADSTGRRNSVGEFIGRCSKSQGLSRAGIQLQRDAV
jgi:hypothetical protein